MAIILPLHVTRHCCDVGGDDGDDDDDAHGLPFLRHDGGGGDGDADVAVFLVASQEIWQHL